MPHLHRNQGKFPVFLIDLSARTVSVKNVTVAVLLTLLTACVVLNAQGLIASMVQYYTPLPIWDYWRVVENYPQMQKGSWGFLWHQHNEHRVLFPELVYCADMLFLHGRKVLPLIAAFFAYAGTWILLSLPVLRDKNLGWVVGAFAAGLAGCIVLFRTAALVLSEPFLLQWTLMSVAVATALLSLSDMSTRANALGRPFALVVASGAVATYSSGNGLVLWPLLLALAVLLRFTPKQLLALTTAAAATIGSFFIRYRTTGSLDIRNLVAHPVHTLGFIASYLSMPFGGLGSVEGLDGLIAGTIALLVPIACAYIGLRRRWLRQPAAVVLFGFLLFNTATALLTAGGRMNPADTAYGGAKAIRYLSVPQLNWAAVILIALWTAAKLNRRLLFGTLAIVALALATYLPKLHPWIDSNAEAFSEDQLATVSFESGVPDWQISFDHVLPDVKLLEYFRAQLERDKLSIYYRGRNRWLGKPAALFAPSRPGIPGAVVAAYPSSSGIQIAGWVDDSTLRLRVLSLLLTDEAGIVKGFARRFPEGFPRTANVSTLPPSLGWAGYVSADMAGQKVFAYAIDARKYGLMPIETPLRIPPLALSSADERGEPIADIDWIVKTSTGQDNPPAVVPTGDLPPEAVHATYAGSDAATGSVVSTPFPRPASGCVIIPIQTGPSVAGLRATLENADTGAVIETLPLRDSRPQWAFWRVPVNPQNTNLRVALYDDGRGWGQWLGTSTPLSCR